MLGLLPIELQVADSLYPIETDYHIILLILQSLTDPDLTAAEKTAIFLHLLYEDDIPPADYDEAIKQGLWFIRGGKDDDDSDTAPEKPVYDWEHDESLIFSAIQKTAGRDIRQEPLHWWTFLSYFDEISDSTFQTVVSIREKQNSHKKLEKYEKEFYKKHKKIVDIPEKLSTKEKQNKDDLNDILQSGIVIKGKNNE